MMNKMSKSWIKTEWHRARFQLRQLRWVLQRQGQTLSFGGAFECWASGLLPLPSPAPNCPSPTRSAHLGSCEAEFLQACQVAVPHRVNLLPLALQERLEGENQLEVWGGGDVIVSAKRAVILEWQLLHTLLEILAHGDDPDEDMQVVRQAQRGLAQLWSPLWGREKKGPCVWPAGSPRSRKQVDRAARRFGEAHIPTRTISDQSFPSLITLMNHRGLSRSSESPAVWWTLWTLQNHVF